MTGDGDAPEVEEGVEPECEEEEERVPGTIEEAEVHFFKPLDPDAPALERLEVLKGQLESFVVWTRNESGFGRKNRWDYTEDDAAEYERAEEIAGQAEELGQRLQQVVQLEQIGDVVVSHMDLARELMPAVRRLIRLVTELSALLGAATGLAGEARQAVGR